MMSIDLGAIRARCERATRGPWYAIAPKFDYVYKREMLCPISEYDDNGKGHEHTWTVSPKKGAAGWCTDGGYSGYGICPHDAEFIAHARVDVPGLLALVELQTQALLAVEWHADTIGHESDYDKCEACQEYHPEHGPKCPLNAEFTAAGLDTQKRRDEARKAGNR